MMVSQLSISNAMGMFLPRGSYGLRFGSLFIFVLLPYSILLGRIDVMWTSISSSDVRAHATRSQHSSVFADRVLYSFGGVSGEAGARSQAAAFHLGPLIISAVDINDLLIEFRAMF